MEGKGHGKWWWGRRNRLEVLLGSDCWVGFGRRGSMAGAGVVVVGRWLAPPHELGSTNPFGETCLAGRERGRCSAPGVVVGSGAPG